MGNNGEYVYGIWEPTSVLGLIQICGDKRHNPPYTFFIDNEFELIEEQQDIEIQEIEEKEWYGTQEISNTISILVKAVKQLDKMQKEG